MLQNYMKSKIHSATVTEAALDYEGSIAIDSQILQTAGIRPYEQVHVYNITNGNRLVTYAIEARAGSGTFSLNGAAAHRGSLGDKIIVVAYCSLTEEELESFRTRVLLLNEKNEIKDSFYARAEFSNC